MQKKITHNANLFAITAIALVCSCSPRVIEHVRTEYVYRDRVQVDTTYLHDSTFIREYIKGDTVRITEYRDRYHYDYKYISKTDTVAVHDTLTVERTKEVEKKLTAWQAFRLRSFGWLLVSLVLALAWIFRKPLLALLKRIL